MFRSANELFGLFHHEPEAIQAGDANTAIKAVELAEHPSLEIHSSGDCTSREQQPESAARKGANSKIVLKQAH